MLSKRFAHADREKCVACGACEKVCPRAAVSVFIGCFARVDAELCIGCGKCAEACPAGCIELADREEL